MGLSQSDGFPRNLNDSLVEEVSYFSDKPISTSFQPCSVAQYHIPIFTYIHEHPKGLVPSCLVPWVEKQRYKYHGVPSFGRLFLLIISGSMYCCGHFYQALDMANRIWPGTGFSCWKVWGSRVSIWSPVWTPSKTTIPQFVSAYIYIYGNQPGCDLPFDTNVELLNMRDPKIKYTWNYNHEYSDQNWPEHVVPKCVAHQHSILTYFDSPLPFFGGTSQQMSERHWSGRSAPNPRGPRSLDSPQS